MTLPSNKPEASSGFTWKELLLRVLALATVAALIVWGLIRSCGSLFNFSSASSVDISAAQIETIRSIGEWEFLAVSDEELIDTTRRGFFSDDHLARIYYGTLRIGIDLQEAGPDCLFARGDTVVLRPPKIRLLDDHFIDEARTEPFHEKGRWTASDREDLYQRAAQRMRQVALSPQNIASAQKNADAQLRKMLTAMGFNNITIEW